VQRWLPRLVAAAATLFLVAYSYLSAVPAMTGWGPTTFTQPRPPGIEVEVTDTPSLDQIASGQGDGSALLRALLLTKPDYPSPIDAIPKLQARFQPPSGIRTELFAIGWPIPWLYRSVRAQYDDARQASGLIAMDWGPTNVNGSWSVGGPARTGITRTHDVHSQFNPGGAAALLLVLIVAWRLSAFVRTLLPSFAPRRVLMCRFLVLALTLAAIAIATLLSAKPSITIEHAPIRSFYWDQPFPYRQYRPFDTGISAADITRFASQQDGAAAIARAIIKHAPTRPVGSLLTFAFTESGFVYDDIVFGGGPAPFWGVTNQHWESPPSTATSGPRRWHFNRGGASPAYPSPVASGQLSLTVYTPDPKPKARIYSLFLANFAITLLGIWLVFQLTRIVFAVTLALIRRRRRIHRRCLACGYDLAGLSAAASAECGHAPP
jgi:hypothetical protein